MTIKSKKSIYICEKEKCNLGDILNKEIVEKITNQQIESKKINKSDIIGIGSVLNEFFDTKSKQKPFIWSSGFIQPFQKKIRSKFKLAALRGKLTLDELERLTRISYDNVILGDGGLLAPYLLDKMPEKKYKLGIIPHYIDQDNQILHQLKDLVDNATIINICGDPIETIKRIAECEIIISSSLHGLIVADSLGIPNQWIRFSDKVIGNDFKFKDYYSVYDIQPKVWDIRNIAISGNDILNIPKNYKITMEDVEDIQDKLIYSLQKIFNVNFKLENKAVPRKKYKTQISVIITCYNYGQYIDQAIQSVKDQTFKDFELIVIDDCSTDEFTQNKIKEIAKDKSLTLVRNTENKGVCASRNYAVSQANGKYIIFLDADDYIRNDCLEKMYNKIQEGLDVVGSYIQLTGYDNGLVNKDYDKFKFVNFDTCLSVTTLIKKRDFELIGGFKNIEGEDYYFWLDFIERNKSVYVIKEPLLFYNRHYDSRDHLLKDSQQSDLDNWHSLLMIKDHPKLFYWLIKEQNKRLGRNKKNLKKCLRLLIINSLILTLFLIYFLI